MAKSCRGWYWHLAGASLLAMGGAIASSSDCALAQITPDATLGAESSVVAPQAPGSRVDVIQGGATRGANLFHSFEQFSVLTGREAFFNNAADVQNIFSRVTGGSVSNIDGLLRANGAANLFLLNPNGISFGSNASLNIGGSFIGSTASSLNFADGTQFSASAHPTTPLLTVSVPIGLQYGTSPGSIQVQGNGQGTRTTTDLIDTTVGLRVQPNQTLALIGGDVALEGGTLKTAGGRIELGSVAGSSLVSLTPTNTGWILGYDGVPTFGDIQLSGAATVDASGAGGGDIQVQGRRVTLTNGSRIEASTLWSEPGGMLSVTTSESVELIGESANDRRIGSGLFTAVYPGATGAGGSLTVETRRLIIRDGAGVSSGTLGKGSAGTLTISARESVELSSTSTDFKRSSFLTAETGVPEVVAATFPFQVNATGQGGDLVIETQRLSVRDGAQVTTATYSEGNAGTLQVDATKSVEVIGTSADSQLFSGLSAAVGQKATGQRGDLRITTGQLNVRDRAFVTVSSQGPGDAGNLDVTARFISLDKQGKLTATTTLGEGGGNIGLQGLDLLLLRGNSEISTNAGGTGNGGNIAISTDILAALENSDITANAFEGRGGNVQINTQGLFLSPDSEITASSERGIDGVVEINNPDVNPSQGLVTLPAEPVDVTGLIAQGCPAGVRSGESKFIITGRGGLPPNPREPLNGDNVLTDWNTLDSDVENRSSTTPSSTNPTKESTPTQIVEANGWMINDKGDVVLTATAPSATLDIPWVPSNGCNAPELES